MKEENLDKIFKKNLEGHETPIDTDALWKAIEADVVEGEKDDRKPFFFWLTGLGGIAVIAIIATIFLFDSSTDNTTASVKISEQKTNAFNRTTENPTNAVNAQVEKRDLPENAAIVLPVTRGTANKKTVTNKKFQNDIDMRFPEQEHARDFDGFWSDETSEQVNTEIPETVFPEEENISENFLSKHENNSNVIVEPLALLSGYLTFEREEHFKPIYKKPPSKEEPSIPKRQFEFSVAPYAAAGLPFRKLEAKTAAAEELLNSRNESEALLETIGGGLDVKVKHKSGFWIATGLEYRQLNERFSYFNQTKRLFSTDTSLTIQNRIVKKEIYNSLKLINIPLTVGYDLQMGEWGVFVETGLLINLSLRSEGVIMGENTEFIDLERGGGEVFSERIGLGYIIGVGVDRKIEDKWEVFLAPQMIVYPGSITKANYALKQKYWLINLKIGTRYHF